MVNYAHYVAIPQGYNVVDLGLPISMGTRSHICRSIMKSLTHPSLSSSRVLSTFNLLNIQKLVRYGTLSEQVQFDEMMDECYTTT